MLRCVIKDDADDEVIIYVDDTKLSLQEFGRLLSVYAGWGMRIASVPEELLADLPKVKLRKRRKRRRQSR